MVPTAKLKGLDRIPPGFTSTRVAHTCPSHLTPPTCPGHHHSDFRICYSLDFFFKRKNLHIHAYTTYCLIFA